MTTETTNSIFSGSPLRLIPGQKLAGCYALEHPLETGGAHLIWIAEDEVLGKRVSLHFLPAAIARDAAARDALRLEVKRSRPLIHPGVLRVYDLVEGDDWTALAMEVFEGRCLAAILEEKGHFEVEEVESWLDQVCVILEEAHRIKLTHRDLSPENIFVTPSGRLLLANFGIGRIVQDALRRAGGKEAEAARLSTLSPQMLEGAAPAATDDVYGVGALFFELLAGAPVFAGADVAEQIRHAVPPRLTELRDEAADPGEEIPAGWENVIAACLNKGSDERPHRPSEIVSSIEAYLPIADPPKQETPAPVVLPIEETPTEVEPPESEAGHVAPKAAAPEPEPPAHAAEVIAPAVAAKAAELKLEAKVEAPAAETVIAPPTLLAAPEASSSAPEAQSAPKIEPKPAPAAAKTASPKLAKYYDTEEDALSGILPRRFRFPAAVAAVVIFLLLLLNGFFTGSKEKNPPPAISTTDPAERSELTSVKNTLTDAAPKPAPEATAPSIAMPPPAPAATQNAPAKPDMIVAAGPTPSLPPAVSRTPAAVPASSVDKDIADKAAAVERLKQELADSDKAQQARLKDQQATAAALAETQKAIDDKTKAAAAAKKATDELLTARKKREDDQKAAETAALAAQQLAAEKAKAAEDARKAFADFEAQNRDKLAAQSKVDAEIQALQQTLADRQKAADANAKAAATADAARQQKAAALQQSEQELAQAKANIAKASAEEERKRQAVDSERKKLDDEIAAMRALFDQKMKDIETRRQQIDSGAAVPPAPAAPTAPAPAPKVAAPPTAEVKPALMATPPPTLPLMAMNPPPAKVPVATPAPAIEAPAPNPAAAPASGSVNSLGLKFAPVGDVQFCIWQTRVKDFEAFAKAVNLKSTAWRGPGFRQGPDHPVVNVTWAEAIAFCKWLTDKEHKEGTLPANQFYRLPYDLEWSKAVGLPDETGKTPEARDMGVPDVYPWGTDWPPPKGAGNYTGEETGSDVAIKGYDDGFAWTSPVGSFAPNKLGLYDMGGNVWQWCMDSWNTESKAKVLRGASWYNGALKLSLLSSCRVHASPDSSTDNYGFRIVRATETGAGKPSKK